MKCAPHGCLLESSITVSTQTHIGYCYGIVQFPYYMLEVFKCGVLQFSLNVVWSVGNVTFSLYPHQHWAMTMTLTRVTFAFQIWWRVQRAPEIFYSGLWLPCGGMSMIVTRTCRCHLLAGAVHRLWREDSWAELLHHEKFSLALLSSWFPKFPHEMIFFCLFCSVSSKWSPPCVCMLELTHDASVLWFWVRPYFWWAALYILMGMS